MQQVIEKALSRANQKGLGVSDTAELIIEYLDIAGVLQGKSDIRLADPAPQRPNSIVLTNVPVNQSSSQSLIEPPPFPVESVITTDQ